MLLPCLIFFFLFCLAFADVRFTFPEAGAVLNAEHVVTAFWGDSGSYPAIWELSQYNLYLCAGGDKLGSYEEIELLIMEGTFERGNSVSFKVNETLGGEDANAYFLKMVSSGPGAFSISYSDRFTLINMKGSFSDRVKESIPSLPDLSGGGNGSINATHDGQREEPVRKRQVLVGAYTLPFNQQTGAIRYAPMAKKPGTTITAKTVSAQYPTSAVETVASTYLPMPDVQMTVSVPNTFTVVSIENTAAAAPRPTGAHQ